MSMRRCEFQAIIFSDRGIVHPRLNYVATLTMSLVLIVLSAFVRKRYGAKFKACMRI